MKCLPQEDDTVIHQLFAFNNDSNIIIQMKRNLATYFQHDVLQVKIEIGKITYYQIIVKSYSLN